MDADDLTDLPAAVEVAAYRIAVEAVNNAVRHGHASPMRGHVAAGDGGLQVEICDDGTGLVADAAAGVGVGVGSMRDRAEELGGTCSVATGPAGGTRVEACLPLSDREGKEEPT